VVGQFGLRAHKRRPSFPELAAATTLIAAVLFFCKCLPENNSDLSHLFAIGPRMPHTRAVRLFAFATTRVTFVLPPNTPFHASLELPSPPRSLTILSGETNGSARLIGRRLASRWVPNSLYSKGERSHGRSHHVE
jgi:hypothetical protein